MTGIETSGVIDWLNGKLAGHQVKIWNGHTKDVSILTDRLKDTKVLVLIRERPPIRAPLLDRLTKLQLISQRCDYRRIDVDVCTRNRVMS